MPAMRDVFWDMLYDHILNNKDIIVFSSDFGAMALDRYRTNLASQYINTGISEQNTILTASGLALSGKTVFITSITPFVSYRCFEQIRLYPAGMNLPVVIVGVGAGVCYEDSGPTHHGTEDISIMRSLPNMRIYTPCDNIQTAFFANELLNIKGPAYVRLDRMNLNDIYKQDDTFKDGFNILKAFNNTAIIAIGNMVHKALEIAETLKQSSVDIGVIDAYRIPFNQCEFMSKLSNIKTLISLEEHNIAGGLGSYIAEIIIDNCLDIKLKRFGFDFTTGFSYDYGGRNAIHEAYGFDNNAVAFYIKEMYKQ